MNAYMSLWRKALAIVAAFLLLAGGVFALKPAMVSQAIAQGQQVITTLVGTEQVPLWYPCTVSCETTTATIAGYGRSTGLLYASIATVADIATTAEQTLASYSLAGGTLKTGTTLRIKASFSAASNAHNKVFKCYFGTSVITSGTLTTNGKNGSCEVMVTRIAANNQTVYANMLVDTTWITGYYVGSTQTDSSAITLKFTGTTASAGTASAADIVMNEFTVERLGQ